jgi:drug/metabolite transporter (DMT)-like permease
LEFLARAQALQTIVERVSKALEGALAAADLREKLDTAGCEPRRAPLAVRGRRTGIVRRTAKYRAELASMFRPDRHRERNERQMDPINSRPSLSRELALLLLLATLWGASYTFIKLGVATIAPITLIAARTSIAGVLLVAIMCGRGVRLPRDAATWRRFLFQAGLNSVIPWTLVAWGERFVDAGLATILNSASPIFTFLLTAAITRHEAATSRKLVGVVAGMAGICLIVGIEAFDDVGHGLLAEIAIVVATICYACAAIFSRGFKGLDPMAPAAGSLLSGAAILIPLCLVVERPWTLAPSAVSLLALLGLAVFSTALAFVIYFRLIQTLGSVGTTAQAYMRVPIGVAIGVLFLGEHLAPTAWIGLVCVVIGVAAMTIPAGGKTTPKAA